jgi:hypothetical protein
MSWTASLDQTWSSSNLPLYLTLATAVFVGIIVLITLLRSERSVANLVLALVTLFAIGVAGVVTFRGFGTASVAQSTEAPRPVQTATAPLPQLSCIDEMAGDAVLAACEKALFGSAESVAAAVAYAASQITLLTSLGDVATANKGGGSDLLALRRAVERDRYGLMAYVLMARDRCTASNCRAFRSLTETRQIAANMEDRVYESLVMRYAASWNAPQAAPGMIAALPPSLPTGKPTNAEFPTSASIPPVSIMTAEPPAGAPKPSSANAAAPAAPAAPRPAAATPPAPPQAQAAAKKPPAAPAPAPAQAPKRPSNGAPVQLAPSGSAPTADNKE